MKPITKKQLPNIKAASHASAGKINRAVLGSWKRNFNSASSSQENRFNNNYGDYSDRMWSNNWGNNS